MRRRMNAAVQVFAVFLIASLIALFQNCSGGGVRESASSQVQTGGTATDTTPNPLNSSAPVKTSVLYIGGTGSVQSYLLDHESDQLTEGTRVELTGQAPGWFDHDLQSGKLFVADASGAHLNVLNLAPEDGSLQFERTLAFLPKVVHLSAHRTDEAFWIHAANHDGAQFSKYELSLDASVARELQRQSYTPGAKTHSSARDEKRGLIFVANRGEGRIAVYREQGRDLIELKSISVPFARMAVFDPIYDKLYVATEVDDGPSFVRIFAITASGSSFNFVDAGSFAMGSRGSDLKIDHSHGYLGVTVRESGKEGIWMLPLTSSGVFDSVRKNTFLPVASVEARSLAISRDGRYYFVTCNEKKNEHDVIVYKIQYAADGSIASSKVIHQIKAGTSEYLSHFLIDLPL